MTKKRLIELVVKMIVAALTAFLTALTTTSCMGHGPWNYKKHVRKNAADVPRTDVGGIRFEKILGQRQGRFRKNFVSLQHEY